MGVPSIPRMPRTKQQKGRAWATATLLLCGTFSIYANVRSGQLYRDSVVVSIVPPIVAFLSSHLISYFNPVTFIRKTLVYGGFGLICVISMYGSGWHIFDFVVKNGQHWSTAISYIFITDAPMLLAAAILVGKESTSRSATPLTQPAKRTTPTKVAKAAPAAKTTGTAANRTTATKSATTTKATKSTKPTIVPNFVGPAIVDETAEVA